MNQAVDPEKKPRHPVSQLRDDMKAALPTLGLPDEKAQERMSSVLMVAVERDPGLVHADRQSLIAAVRQCANHGLVPDGNEATLQVYNAKVKDQWIKKVQYQPMVRGIINRVLKSGKVLSFWAEVVYAGEPFQIDISQGDRRPAHQIENHFDRGGDKDIAGVYSVAKLKNGTIDCEVMPLEEIDKVRKAAKTQKVWEGWFSEKARVAVMRRHSKRLPLSAEDLDMILNRGSDEYDFDREVKDVTPEENVPLAQRIKKPDEPIEGEIMDDDKPHWTTEIDTSDAAPGDEMFIEGGVAFNSGKARQNCPHNDTVLAAQWLGGWDAQKEGITS